MRSMNPWINLLLLYLATSPVLAQPIPSPHSSAQEPTCAFPSSCRPPVHQSRLPYAPVLKLITFWRKPQPLLPPRDPHFPPHQLVPAHNDILLLPAIDPVIPPNRQSGGSAHESPNLTASKAETQMPVSTAASRLALPETEDAKAAGQFKYGIAAPETGSLYPPVRSLMETEDVLSMPRNLRGEACPNGVGILLLFIAVVVVAEMAGVMLKARRRGFRVTYSESGGGVIDERDYVSSEKGIQGLSPGRDHNAEVGTADAIS